MAPYLHTFWVVCPSFGPELHIDNAATCKPKRWLATVQAVHVESEAEFYRKSCAGAQFILRRLDRGPLGGPLLSPPGGLPPAVLPALCLSS